MCVRFSEDAHSIINVSIVKAEQQKNNQFWGQINKKTAHFYIFPHIFFIESFIREKKKS